MTPILFITPASDALQSINSRYQIDLDSHHPDHLIVDQADKIGIGQIRQSSKYINTPPLKNPAKFLIIINAHQLTLEAQNSFLKTLEECPSSNQIILQTHNLHLLIPTIISRCLTVYHIPPSIPHIDPHSNKLINQITSSDISNKFLIAQQLLSNKDSLIPTIKTLIQTYRYQLHRHPLVENAHNIKVLHQALIQLDKNVNPKLCLEHALLKLQPTKPIQHQNS